MRSMGCIDGPPGTKCTRMGPGGAIPMGEYFSGVGDDAVLPTTGTIAESPNAWKGPWFFGLFVGTIVGISIGKLTK